MRGLFVEGLQSRRIYSRYVPVETVDLIRTHVVAGLVRLTRSWHGSGNDTSELWGHVTQKATSRPSPTGLSAFRILRCSTALRAAKIVSIKAIKPNDSTQKPSTIQTLLL